MKLEVGMYARTKKGTIFKVIGGNVDMWEIDIDYSYLSNCENEDYHSYAYNKNNSLFEELIVKTSYNIIDLIEVGDYVNGYLVTDVYKPDGNEVFRIEIERDTLIGHIINKSSQIKSIVTKEQMEQMKYRVE